MRARSFAAAVVIVAGCGTSEPALTDATSLTCPNPGALPFRLPTHGFVSADNQKLVAANPRSKDEASDTIGNPGGPFASIYLADTAAPDATPIDYHGVKARTTHTGGLFESPIPGEHVSLWSFDPAATTWNDLGETTTGSDGSYDLPGTGFVAANHQPVYAMLDADGSCAEHDDFLLPPGSKVVVTDIDGTLTLSDNELLMELTDDTYVPVLMGAADRMTQAWAAKGYPVIYLTARPHLFRDESRVWLRDEGFPNGPLLTAIVVEDAAAFKTVWLQRMMTTFGWVPVAAYGNAETDIAAYNNVGIAKAITFIVGPLAGTEGTQPIANMDFSDHITTFIDAQPANN